MVNVSQKKFKELKEQLEKTRKDLEDLELYTQDLISFVPVAFCLLSGVGKIVNSNKALEDLIGYDLMEASGGFLEKFFLEKKRIRDLLKEASKKETIKNREFTLTSKERKEIPVSLSISTRRDQEGNLIGYFVGILDITELKELQESLEKKVEERTKELQERIDELEKFRKLTVGRELRMVELKEEIERLKEKTKEDKSE